MAAWRGAAALQTRPACVLRGGRDRTRGGARGNLRHAATRMGRTFESRTWNQAGCQLQASAVRAGHGQQQVKEIAGRDWPRIHILHTRFSGTRVCRSSFLGTTLNLIFEDIGLS